MDRPQTGSKSLFPGRGAIPEQFDQSFRYVTLGWGSAVQQADDPPRHEPSLSRRPHFTQGMITSQKEIGCRAECNTLAISFFVSQMLKAMLSAMDKKGESYAFANVTAELEKILRSILPEESVSITDLTDFPWHYEKAMESEPFLDYSAAVRIQHPPDVHSLASQ